MKPDPKKERLAAAKAKQVEEIRRHVLEHALVGFVEQIDNRVPDDETIIREGMNVQFPAVPSATYSHQNHHFSFYFVWRGKHALAHAFDHPKNIAALSVVRVPDDAWPPALREYVSQHRKGHAPES